MTPLGPASIPRIGYLFDFQHRHLPHLFSARLRRKRDRNFSKLAKDADGIVVNSRSVADDAIRFLGVAAEDMLVLPFSPYVQDWWFQTDPVVVRDRYGLPSRFLLICNHFWTHKDHATAIRAFARLHADSACRDMQLVMTGDPIDHRDPAHFSRLQRLVGELGIASSTRFLGLIPKHEQIALMRGCSLLIQPTLFEGGPGGGSVYEAVGLGVPALVSDIPVNREIDAPNVRFFRAGDDRALAEATFAWLQALPPAADRLQLIEASDARLALMGSLLAGFLIDRATRGRVGTT